MFRTAFGEPFDPRRFNRWNLFRRLPAYIADPQRPALYLAVGDNDFPRLKAGNIAFHRALADAGNRDAVPDRSRRARLGVSGRPSSRPRSSGSTAPSPTCP